MTRYKEGIELAEMIIDARNEHGLSRTQLAQKAGISQATIVKLESGGGNPSFKTLNRIARALDKRVVLQ